MKTMEITEFEVEKISVGSIKEQEQNPHKFNRKITVYGKKKTMHSIVLFANDRNALDIIFTE